MEGTPDMHIEKSETVAFVDSSVGVVGQYALSDNPIALADQTTDISLERFLSRPIEIDQRSWSTSDVIGPIGSSISPWWLYLSNAAVSNKLANFPFLRAKLCLKTVVNGTPFHYGKLRFAYEPSVAFDGTGFRTSKIRAPVTGTRQYMVPYSQLPGYWINPADNSGGEMCLPLFLHKNWINLGSAAETKRLGKCDFFAYTPLSVAATGGTTSITLTTYAWLEDVHLMGSTNQALLQGDEYDGKISGPASAVSRVAGMLSNVPIIGRFARATQMATGAVAGIAHLFGFTNVPNIDTVSAFAPTPGPHIASSEISVPHQKLTLDPKQELSIDPRIHNIGSEDEMVIQNIITKKSVLDTFSWVTTQSSGVTLFNCLVNPALFQNSLVNNVSAVLVGYRTYHTPLSYVNALFSHWRGDIIFSFDIVCSKFHKGRLRVTWDPLGGIATSVPLENTVYSTIIDIGATNNVEFRVPYHQALAWQATRDVTQTVYTAGTSNTINPLNDNGMITLSVLNPLLAPVTPSTVYIVVSVRAAENLEFANPRNNIGGTVQTPSFFPLQGDSIEIESELIPLANDGEMHNQRYGLNFGEAVVSLRTLLHRQTLSEVNSIPGTTGAFVVARKSFSRLPGSTGFDPNGTSGAVKVVAASGNAPYNFATTTPVAYVAWMYGGYRGSTNWTLNIGHDIRPSISHINVERKCDSSYQSSKRFNTFVGPVITATQNVKTRYLIAAGDTGTAGAAITNTLTNGGLQFQFPDYNNFNFAYPDPTYWASGNTNDGTDVQAVTCTVLMKQAAADEASYATVSTYVGTGPDFQCLWWLCCPTIEYGISLPSTT